MALMQSSWFHYCKQRLYSYIGRFQVKPPVGQVLKLFKFASQPEFFPIWRMLCNLWTALISKHVEIERCKLWAWKNYQAIKESGIVFKDSYWRYSCKLMGQFSFKGEYFPLENYFSQLQQVCHGRASSKITDATSQTQPQRTTTTDTIARAHLRFSLLGCKVVFAVTTFE